MWGLDKQIDKQLTVVYIVAAVVGIVLAIVLGFVCRSIVKGKGYPDQMNHGFAWGFWLGLIGLIVCACKVPYSQNNNQMYYNGQPMNGQPPYNGQPMNGQPYNGQPMNGQPYNGQPMNGQPYNGQPMNGQPMNAQSGGEWTCSCGCSNPAGSNFCNLCGASKPN